jgi:hypothetical protein
VDFTEVHYKLAGSEGVDSGHRIVLNPISKPFKHGSEVPSPIGGIFVPFTTPALCKTKNKKKDKIRTGHHRKRCHTS